MDSIIATLQPSKTFTEWQPEPGFLFLLPSRTSSKHNGLILPESVTKKQDSGICFAQGYLAGQPANQFIGKECLFPQHTQYTIQDSETGYEIFVLPADKVIMVRIPPPDVFRFSQKKPADAPLKFSSIEHTSPQATAH